MLLHLIRVHFNISTVIKDHSSIQLQPADARKPGNLLSMGRSKGMPIRTIILQIKKLYLWSRSAFDAKLYAAKKENIMPSVNR